MEGQWVFVGIERSSDKIFLVPVEKRDRETLTEIIVKWIKPGTTIISDCWKVYEKLEEIGYCHFSFIDQDTGAHTNTIESTWRHTKKILPEIFKH